MEQVMKASDPPARRFIDLRKHRRLVPPPGSLLSFTRLAMTADGCDAVDEGDGIVLNLSTGGCGIETGTLMTLGQPYSLILQVPSLPTPITVDTAIVRWIGEQMFGFRFDAIQREQEEQLRELLHRLRATTS